ncbi:hypothetical protein [Tardiphaga sp.]|jgi:hypothetical protein|uniref:hypothetical protein n=1 Tax=Tardiphaga sp. TaxID=1926292 RepID=UPI0037DA506A
MQAFTTQEITRKSVGIALGFLKLSGELEDEAAADLFITKSVERMMDAGIKQELILANSAIAEYRNSTRRDQSAVLRTIVR